MKVIIKHPGQRPYVTNISTTLKNLQISVNGYIETVFLQNDLVVICNEEGLLQNLPHNCCVEGIDFVGTIIFIGKQGEEFSDIPCEFQQFKKLYHHLFE